MYKIRYEASLIIQFANGLTKSGRPAYKSQTIPCIRWEVKDEEIISVIDVVRPVMMYEITGVKLVRKKITTILDSYTRKEEREETVEVKELLAQEGVQESMAQSAAAQAIQTRQQPAVFGDIEPAAVHGIDFSNLSGNTMTNREAQPFGVESGASLFHKKGTSRNAHIFGAEVTPTPVHGVPSLDDVKVFDLLKLMHENPLKGTTAEIGYVPPITIKDAPVYGLPPLLSGGS